MKKILSSLAILLFVFYGNAQEEKKKLFNMSDHIGGYGGVTLSLNKDANLSVIGEGAFLYRNFYLGGFGFGATYADQLSEIDNYSYTLSSGQGGFMLGAYSNTNNFFALFAETKFGFGEAIAKREISTDTYKEYNTFLFSFIPKVGISINPIPLIQIRLDLAYQLTNNFDLNGIENSAINGVMFGLGIYLGYF